MKIIAETAWHHEGDLEFLVSLTESISSLQPVDIIKYHVLLDPDEYFTPGMVERSGIHKYLFSEGDWRKLAGIVRKAGKELMLLLNDRKAVSLAAGLRPEYVEIHSVALNDIHLLASVEDNIGPETKIILGIGGSGRDEIENALGHLPDHDVILMYGIQGYPTETEDINFLKMKRLMELFPQCKFGYADHSSPQNRDNILITLFGAAQGVEYLEKHITTVPGIKRIDSEAAITPDMLEELHNKLLILKSCLGSGTMAMNPAEKKYAVSGTMKKAPVAAKDLNEGHLLTMKDIAFKRTVEKSEMDQLGILDYLGCPLSEAIKKDEMLLAASFNCANKS